MLKYTIETDKVMLNDFSNSETSKLLGVLNIWGKALLNEDFKELRKIKMHIIPTQNLKIFEKFKEMISNNIGIDFKTFDDRDTFQYAFTYVKVPYYIFLCSVWGSTSSMKQFKVANVIKPRVSNLPDRIKTLITTHMEKFDDAKQQISTKQVKSILGRANELKG